MRQGAGARSPWGRGVAGYMGQSSAFEDALTDFSVAYADQNERDHAALVAAVRAVHDEVLQNINQRLECVVTQGC